MHTLMLFCIGLFISAMASADNGIVNVPSPYAVADTVSRLENVIKSKGLTLFAHISHSGEAQKAGLSLRPTELIIFGNPKGGTPIMQAAPSAALDLPLKALVWQDDHGKVWVSYNSGAYLQARHGLDDARGKPLGTVGGLIDKALQ